jgi:hypothetical protein
MQVCEDVCKHVLVEGMEKHSTTTMEAYSRSEADCGCMYRLEPYFPCSCFLQVCEDVPVEGMEKQCTIIVCHIACYNTLYCIVTS